MMWRGPVASAFPYTGALGLAATNGNKVVEGPDKVYHLVYTETVAGVSTVQHRTRSSGYDGLPWSAPEAISPAGVPCDHPTIGVDASGNLGAAFVCNGALRYASKPSGGSWTLAATPIDPGGVGSPTMIGYGSDVHLAWQNAVNIYYVSFPTLAPHAWGPAPDAYVADICTCLNTEMYSLPSIAVAPGPTPGQPVVQVAYFEHVTTAQSYDAFGVAVAARPGAGFGGVSWPQVFTSTVVDGPSPEGVAVSLDGGAKGDFLLMWSDVTGFPVTARTMLAKMNANNTWITAVPAISSTDMFVDVSHTIDFSFLLSSATRITTVGGNLYGDVKQRYGMWPDGASAPTLYASWTMLEPTSREPEVVKWFGPIGAHCPRVVWDRVTGTAHSIDQSPNCPHIITTHPPVKCPNLISIAIGKSVSDATGCESTATGRGAAVDPACLARVSAKFDKTVAKLAARADCIVSPDEGAIESARDAYLDDVENMLLPAVAKSRCTARKLGAAGKKVLDLMKCHGKAIAKGAPTDTACVMREQAKFAAAFTKAETLGDCLAPVGDAASIESRLDLLVADAVCQIDPSRCP
jgi:hypothetical protein